MRPRVGLGVKLSLLLASALTLACPRAKTTAPSPEADAAHPGDSQAEAGPSEPAPPTTEINGLVHYRGNGPAPPAPTSEEGRSPPLTHPRAPSRLSPQWFRPGIYTRMSATNRLDDGFVLVGADPQLGEGISRLDREGTVLWHRAGPVEHCVLNEAHNVLCRIDELRYALYDDSGREVWQRDLSELVTNSSVSEGFGSASLDSFSAARLRVVQDAAFIELRVVRHDAPANAEFEYLLLCLSLSGEVAWVQGSLAEGGLSSSLSDHAFESPAELALSYARAGLPKTPWGPEPLPASAELQEYVQRMGKRLRSYRTGSGWFLVVDVGPKPQRWAQKRLFHVSPSGDKRPLHHFDAPSERDDAHPVHVISVLEGPTDQIYIQWADGRIHRLSPGREPVPLTYARYMTLFPDAEDWALLVWRTRRKAPPGLPTRDPGLELFQVRTN